ncbi:hypothetical protein ACIQKB_38605 [Streptomyces sp. NPDC092046]|uniref:hypothetical protein n=1 Tax=Streptomyces sp. NPDC092046 TaxID=3366009 RepID=UPI00380095A8
MVAADREPEATERIGMAITSHDRPAYEVERAAALLMGLFEAVGDGCHTLTLVAYANGSPLAIAVPFHVEGEEFDADPDLALEALVALRLAATVGGSAVVRTRFADGERVCGWRLIEFYAVPLGAAEIFNAYCTDPETGEPIPPEWGVDYVAAPTVRT